jgi:hypothetical protein
MFEWSVEACLQAASKYDSRVIQEAESDDEYSQMHKSILLTRNMIIEETIINNNNE